MRIVKPILSLFSTRSEDHRRLSTLQRIGRRGSSNIEDLPAEKEHGVNRAWLRELGYSDYVIEDVIEKLEEKPSAKDRGADDGRQKIIFVKNLSSRTQALNIDKDLELANLAEFLAATRAKASFYSLLNYEFELSTQLIWLFSASPFYSRVSLISPDRN